MLIISSNKSFAYSSAGDSLSDSLANPVDYPTPDQLLQFLPNLPGFQKGFISNSTAEQFKLLNTQNLSFDDVTGSLKSIAVLAINLFLIVIQVVVGILKALLPFLR